MSGPLRYPRLPHLHPRSNDRHQQRQAIRGLDFAPPSPLVARALRTNRRPSPQLRMRPIMLIPQSPGQARSVCIVEASRCCTLPHDNSSMSNAKTACTLETSTEQLISTCPIVPPWSISTPTVISPDWPGSAHAKRRKYSDIERLGNSKYMRLGPHPPAEG
ncbi:hypothetical protein BV22DRAFT_493451 [Leucogyrophana mollusca]|uniref:Uncharacterized protein n=1 Tax=Leucogyrophana mollusca TaxID=85980 RepID=A0ACB8BIL4_9AGAM|nr:hypothetical protein BV22DRAFT_493451 [Leucogyrophana mollusca]